MVQITILRSLRVKEKDERAAEEKPLGGVSRACC
jgi:hypothetical protein